MKTQVKSSKLRRAILTVFYANGEITGDALKKAFNDGVNNPDETISKALEISNQAKQKHLDTLAAKA